MATFKVQPVYAELILGWLDASMLEVGAMTVDKVLSTVEWRFKGGTLGSYPMQYPTESSCTRYPDGLSTDLALKPDDDPDRAALLQLVRNRIRDRKKRVRSCADWASSFALCSSVVMLSPGRSAALTGMPAVYRVLQDIWENCESPPMSDALPRLRSFVRECTLCSSAASHLDIPTTEAVVSATFYALTHTRMAALKHAAAEFDRMMRYTGSGDARARAVKLGRGIISDPRAFEGLDPRELLTSRFTTAGRMYYAAHGCLATILAGRAVCLSRSDIARVHQFLSGAQSGLFATVSQACVAPGPERMRATEIGAAYERQVNRILAGARTVRAGNEVTVCKSLKRAFGAFLGELSGPLCADETAVLWAEARATVGAEGMDLDGWVSEIRPWCASTAFNLGKVYKLCPAPDASPGLTMIERHEMICNHNTPDPAMLEDFRSELRSQILRAYIRRPGVKLEAKGVRPAWFGAYRSGKFDEVPSDEIADALAWEGSATMPTRSPDDPAVWKDSGLGWDSWDIAVDPDRPQRHGNMLMRMVFDSEVPMPGVRHSGHLHTHKVDIKPEGHKDPARGIYSGNIRDRLNQSWMEAAVQDVACGHPSFMIGADVEAREARVRAIVDRPHEPDMCALYYSFDVAGWSPRMCPEVQHTSHDLWGELYDEELFRNAWSITDGSFVYMNKGGYRGWFVNPGANFEGYNGKEMTMILITLMSLAVKDWRAEIVRKRMATAAEASKWSAVLLAYIDDGLAKIVLPTARAKGLFAEFKLASEHRFRGLGFTIEQSKCYPSDRFAIFLNEPYLAGRHVTHGTRAAMTICAENTEEHTSIIERTTSVSTGCRGSVMSGLDATAGVMLQAYHVFLHLEEWLRRPDPVVSALWAMLPRAWGGLGMPSALQLGTSGTGSAFEEGIRNIQQWAKISTAARRAFLTRTKSSLVPRTATGVLLSGLGGRTGGATMVETRVPDAVRSALVKLKTHGALSRLALDFLGYSSPESLDAYAEALIPMSSPAVMQEQLLDDLASAHPHAIFSSFARRIEKSTTLMQLVGHRELRRIIKGNREDASMSFSSCRAMLLI